MAYKGRVRPTIALTSADIAVDAVGSSEIAAGAVDTAEIATNAVTANEIAAGAVAASEIASTFDISSKTVTLPAAAVTAHVTAYDDNQLKEDIAITAFHAATAGSLAKYDLVDQTIDAFSGTTGVDTSNSVNEFRNPSNFITGATGNENLTAFTSSGTFTTDAVTTKIEVLVVAGGGSTGDGISPGGGGGGIVHHTGYVTTVSTTYGVTVGGSSADSVFDTAGVGTGPMTAKDGGDSGTRFNSGGVGGSGSGGGYDTNNAGGAADQSDSGGGTGYGYAGGNGLASSPYPSGGGGGAGGVGGSSTSNTSDTDGPTGGLGKYFSSFVAYGTDSNNVASTGANGGWFASGGGGARNSGYSSYNAKGGGGGGGGGGQANNSSSGVSGLANTGGGGGGGGGGASTGGSGVVLIKNILTVDNLTLISNSTTAQDGAPTKGDLIFTYSNGVGTAVVGTDLKAYISRDGGSNYTGPITMTAQGTTGGHTILTAHDVSLTSTSGTAMRYKITTHNQSAGSKETRIHAVSLGWS